MDELKFSARAKQAVANYINCNLESHILAEEVYIVWMCKTLKNNKALLSTNIPDGMYYEVTWNGSEDEGYLDCYKKIGNYIIKGA